MQIVNALLRAVAERDMIWFVRPLLAAGANPYDTDRKGRTAFNRAASGGLRALRLLTKEAFYDTQRPPDRRRWGNYELNTLSGCYSSTLITYAAKVSPVSLVESIIKAGADITIVNGSGWTLLHCAAVMPGRAEILKNLVQAFRTKGREDLITARSTHLYETDYGSGKIVYSEGLTAAELCRARMAQDSQCPKELAGYPDHLEETSYCNT